MKEWNYVWQLLWIIIQFIPITNIDYTIYNVPYFIVYSLENTDETCYMVYCKSMHIMERIHKISVGIVVCVLIRMLRKDVWVE